MRDKEYRLHSNGGNFQLQGQGDVSFQRAIVKLASASSSSQVILQKSIIRLLLFIESLNLHSICFAACNSPCKCFTDSKNSGAILLN